MMTVAELIAHLKQYDLSVAVFLDCSDEHYSGPLTPETMSIGELLEIGPHDTPVHLVADDYTRGFDNIVGSRQALIIRVE